MTPDDWLGTGLVATISGIDAAFTLLAGLLPIFALLFAALLPLGVVVVGGKELAIVERKWFGRPTRAGRVLALPGEVGIQARILGPGIHFLVPFLYKATKEHIVRIGENEVGLIEAVDGAALEPGRIFARGVPGHDRFQNAEAFLQNGGQKGPQAETLPPGFYRLNSVLFRVTIVKALEVAPGKVGVVSAADGEPIPPGRLLGQRVGGHDDFQDGAKFLAAGGARGPQIDLLLPGTYRIHTGLFHTEVRHATVVPVEQVGLVTARDGTPLPPSEYVATVIEGHREFQDGPAFLALGGQRGPQLGFLRPGTYYINPLMFDVQCGPVTIVERGHVAVVVSNVGLEPAGSLSVRDGTTSAPTGIERYVVDSGYRGIRREVVGPGTYYLNRFAFVPHVISTTNITVDWADEHASGQSQCGFPSLAIVSKDGFEMTISVKVIFRVMPEQAPHMVARIGTIDNLIHNVIHPLVDSSLRNQASATEAMKFMQDRQVEQMKAEDHIRRELDKYHVTCVSALICQVILPTRLMETLTEKVVASQQMSMFDAQRLAEDRRKEMANTKAQANLQASLVESEVNVQIAQQKKQEMVTLAEGRGQATKLEQEGQAAGVLALGRAEGEKIRATGLASAEAYERQAHALGPAQVALVEVVERIASGHVKVTPDIWVGGTDSGNGGAGGAGAGILTALVAKLMADGLRPSGESRAREEG
jgi:regulator of protease activity HflC (stomatin/prohibitin superfamily)